LISVQKIKTTLNDITSLVVKHRHTIDDIAELAVVCRRDGLDALMLFEQQRLCDFFAKELRKGTFAIPADATARGIRDQFCRYLEREAKSSPMLYVWNPLQHLKRKAFTSRSKKDLPIVPLIVYATWIENWLNMVIIVSMLKQNSSNTKIRDACDQGIASKLTFLSTGLGLPQIPSELNEYVTKLARERNELVHFKWKGITLQERKALTRRIIELVDDGPTMVKKLQQYEFQSIDSQFTPVVTKVFPRSKHNN